MTLVEQIKRHVTLHDVASMVSIELPKRTGIKFSSPFRPDKNPSCSIYQRGNEARFRDWSRGIDVDVIGFYALARDISDGEAIHELKHHLRLRSNGDPEDRRVSVVTTTEVAPPLSTPAKPANLPKRLAETWRDGVEYLAGNKNSQRRIGEWRGWPPEFVAQLADDGVMGTPMHKGDRLVAFRVDYPVVKDFDVFGRWFCTEQIGFHVRLKPSSAGDKASWRFYPNGGEHGQSIPALPFIIGEFTTARLLVITEGQWDAITFALAAGWFSHDGAWSDGLCVIGIRGANGINPFLTHYAAHWPRAPKCLLLADNDRAGSSWFESREGRSSFAERLIGRCSEVHVETVAGAKDFNEAWKRRLITQVDISREFTANGFSNEKGQAIW